MQCCSLFEKSQAANFKDMSVLRWVSMGPCSFCSSMSGIWGGSRRLWPPFHQLLGSSSSWIESAPLSNIHGPFPCQVSKVSDLLLHLKIVCLVCLFIFLFIFGGPVNQTQGPASCSVIVLTSNPCLALGLLVFIWGVFGLFVVLFMDFWDMSHVSLDWSETHCVPKDDLDVFVFLPSSSQYWNPVDNPLQPASALACFVLKTELFM